jgi:hypothetical protein
MARLQAREKELEDTRARQDDAIKPSTSQPVQQPSARQPAVRLPAACQPPAVKLLVRQPAVRQPAVRLPAVRLPAVSQPPAVKPLVCQPPKLLLCQPPAVRQPFAWPPAVKLLVCQPPELLVKPAVRQTAVRQSAVRQSAVRQAVRPPAKGSPTHSWKDLRKVQWLLVSHYRGSSRKLLLERKAMLLQLPFSALRWIAFSTPADSLASSRRLPRRLPRLVGPLPTSSSRRPPADSFASSAPTGFLRPSALFFPLDFSSLDGIAYYVRQFHLMEGDCYVYF